MTYIKEKVLLSFSLSLGVNGSLILYQPQLPFSFSITMQLVGDVSLVGGVEAATPCLWVGRLILPTRRTKLGKNNARKNSIDNLSIEGMKSININIWDRSRLDLPSKWWKTEKPFRRKSCREYDPLWLFLPSATEVAERLCFHKCLSFCPRGLGGVHPPPRQTRPPLWVDTPRPGRPPQPGRHPLARQTLPPPWADCHCSGRYASYWNALL